MSSLSTILLLVVIVSSFLIQTEGADKYTDENRPYEFGFNIEGEQHRHEKKDEKGLIMGEFGFITADGVYHVTVYATDEQGRFKILSMKNIRVKPYPTYKRPEAGSERQGHSLELPRTTIPKSQVRKPEPPKKISIEPPARSCSSCSLPTTQAPAPAFVQPNYYQNALKPQTGFSNQNGPGQSSPSFDPERSISTQTSELGRAGIPGTAVNAQTGFNSQNGPGQSSPSFDPSRSKKKQTAELGGAGISRTAANAQTGFNSQNLPDQELVYPQQNSPSFNPSEPTNQRGGAGIARTAKKYDGQSQYDQEQGLPKKPTLISAQMQIVDKNTDIYRRGPGEKEGLPKGLAKEDMTQLLYTFNYTVGFHGHFEEGYRNGAKQGYYFITGRNGVRTRVDYVADENGFRPTITQEVLDVLSDDVPKPETEKDEKYGLKGYEFKWLYFPVESKGR